MFCLVGCRPLTCRANMEKLKMRWSLLGSHRTPKILCSPLFNVGVVPSVACVDDSSVSFWSLSCTPSAQSICCCNSREIRHKLAEIESSMMEQGLRLNVEVKWCFFCVCTHDNIVNICGVEKESNKCLIGLQKILQGVPNHCVKQKGTGRHPKHNSHKSEHSYSCLLGSALIVSSIQRNLRTSRSRAITEIASRLGFKVILYILNLKSRSSINWLTFGPFWSQSFNEGPLHLAEVSYTMRSFVVILSVRTMA